MLPLDGLAATNLLEIRVGDDDCHPDVSAGKRQSPMLARGAGHRNFALGAVGRQERLGSVWM